MKTKPKDATHWSVRTMAGSQRVSAATVYRVRRKQPHRPGARASRTVGTGTSPST